jgi:hypothetical protein
MIPMSVSLVTVSRGFLNLTGRSESQTSLPNDSSNYFSFAYSAFAAMRIGMSGSASFQSVRKS